ncbi:MULTISPECIES: hypothetical protein [unclassified Paenibacillus]|uniref:hypothetical protein n=1 Tax=unclassified Paenibacillus TaxID=185978 RepID=UPI00020D7009|nr:MULTISPECIES: hypothetical protein [unclassified Paenibacillus]EGL20055.1 hypothetical protein HMPREF9413_1083 [Paenibacillus sp. HGF7]EPD82021.1 hypothetical protein HMPREF1207_03847 [Paenibacillus sp. HGH0039]
MKDYSKWMSPNSDSEEIVFDLCEKSKVKINDLSTGSVTYDAIINDANEWQKDVDMIVLIKKTVYEIKTGDYIEIDNTPYIVLFQAEDRDFFWSVRVRKCHSRLKWTNKAGQLIEVPFWLENVTSAVGIESGKIINLPNEERKVTIQFNVDTAQIGKSHRFILDRRAWKVSAIDGLSRANLLTLTLQEVAISSSDKVEEGIAYNKW